jgi:TetR/AcrR family transcriptional regulator, cholesterol catabolism regulator
MDSRERIIEVAAEMFSIYGMKAVTMDSLAGQLGMSKRTIYEIFADKDELLIGVLQSMSERQNKLVKKVLDESGNAIVAIFKLLEFNREHFQNMSPAFQADLKRFHHSVLLKKKDKSAMPDYSSNKIVIEQGIKQKLFRKDINADLVNRSLYGIARSVMDNELYPFDLFSRREVLRNGFINYLRGISTPEGIRLINTLDEKF